jgi:hypothetical protein
VIPLNIRPGDKLRCCDPWSSGVIVIVRYVVDRIVYGLGQYGSYIHLDRVHTDPNSKSGWYLMPREEVTDDQA